MHMRKLQKAITLQFSLIFFNQSRDVCIRDHVDLLQNSIIRSKVLKFDRSNKINMYSSLSFDGHLIQGNPRRKEVFWSTKKASFPMTPAKPLRVFLS